MGDPVVENGRELHLLKHVVVVVGGHPCRCPGRVPPRPLHGGNPGHPRAQLQVGHGIVDAGDPFSAMRAQSSSVVQTQWAAMAGWCPRPCTGPGSARGSCPSVPCRPVLRLGLGDMDASPVFSPGVRRHPLPQGDVGGILPWMEASTKIWPFPAPCHSSVSRRWLSQSLQVAGLKVRRGPEVDPPQERLALMPAFQHGLGDVGGTCTCQRWWSPCRR